MQQKQTGSGLIFAVVLLFVILGMVITLASVTMLETKMNQKTKSSVGAFYNSESGVEWALNQIATKDGTAQISTIGACPFTGCSVLFLDKDGKVLASSATINEVKAVRSIGNQGGETQRAIEAAVASGSCPTGYLDGGSFCIEPNEHISGTTNWWDAANTCHGSGARLCSAAEWYYACMNLSSMNNKTDDRESINEISSPGVVLGNGGCNVREDVGPNDPQTFRCCANKQ